MNAPRADQSEAFREGHRAEWMYGRESENPYKHEPTPIECFFAWDAGAETACRDRKRGLPNPYQPTTTC